MSSKLTYHQEEKNRKGKKNERRGLLSCLEVSTSGHPEANSLLFHSPHTYTLQSILCLFLDSCHLAGADMDVCLTNYGHCNYVSGKHACIFYDEVRGKDGWEGAFPT